MNARLSVVVPTLGQSRWLEPCLQALRDDGGSTLEILLVEQGEAVGGAARGLADRVLRSPRNLGFAAANNRALAEARGELLATVNDDVVVGEGWCTALLEALERHPEAAAVQGLNLCLDEPRIVDGGGLGWNRFWQAVQLGHGRPRGTAPEEEREVFGVSATAAIYRRQALAEVGGARLAAFDERLFAYYEDVDLACRLRHAGSRAYLVPAARARHAGSASGGRLPWGGRQLICGNRLLVLARLLGRAFWPRLPWILLRDALDLAAALRRGEPRTAAGIVAGLGRAMARGARFAHLGRPLVSAAELGRFRVDRGGWSP